MSISTMFGQLIEMSVVNYVRIYAQLRGTTSVRTTALMRGMSSGSSVLMTGATSTIVEFEVA